jgi:hypothetical protein
MRVRDTLTPEAWRGSQRDTLPAGSGVCEEGMLRAVAETDPVDLITRQQYRHCALTLEWRVTCGGHSGILYHGTEALPHAWQRGVDMQLLDDADHLDGLTPETSAGALYGLMAPWRAVLRPIGSFNTARSWSRPATWNSGSMGCWLWPIPCRAPPWQRWWPRAPCRRCPALARWHGAISHSSIIVPRCGAVTSVCVPSPMRTLAVCQPRGRRDPRRHVASARRRHAQSRARGRPVHDIQDRRALRARTP